MEEAVSDAVLDPSVIGSGGGSAAGEPAFEQRGIDYIPHSERRGKPLDLTWMWAGALFNVEYVVYGALLITFGLTFWQAALVIAVGNLSYIVAGLGSLQGPAAGTSAFAISRASFGPNGARGVSLFNWITQVGYETEGLALIVLAGLALADKAGVHSSTGLKVGLIVVAAFLQLFLPLMGHGTMLRILRYLALPFVALFIVFAILALPKAHLGAGTNASWQTMMVALALILSAGGYGWVMNANDYSRYLPTNASRKKIVWSVAIGGYVPSTLLGLLGAAVATAVPSASDPIGGLPHAFSSWFLVPYLIFIIFQLFAINSIDLYSSGLTLQAIIPKIKRWQCVLLDTTVAGALTAVAIFSSGFNTFLTDFLLFMIIWIAPWVAIFLVDWFMRRGTYDSRSLLNGRAGIYWRKGGIHYPGLIAQIVGMLAAASFLNTTVWQGPLVGASSPGPAADGADFSVFMGALFAGVVYYLLARKTVPKEVGTTEEPTAAPPVAASTP
jgi:NCS1 family nucleobase:cation symporter-1